MNMTKTPYGIGEKTASEIDTIDATLDMRGQQMDDPSVDSYTLGLLRDPNMAGKKLGEEVLELAMAVTTDEEGETQASEEEIADILYASLVFARSRGREVRLGNVLGILVGRNERKTAEEEMGSFPEFSQES